MDSDLTSKLFIQLGGDMFKNVLIPVSIEGLKKTDIKKLFNSIGADVRKVTLTFVSDPFPPYMYAEYGDVYTIADADHRKACRSFADKLFTKVGSKLNGVIYDTCHIYNANVVDGIIDASKKSKADVIAMVSHKRRGLAGVFLGSDTQRVILSTKLPVLVV